MKLFFYILKVIEERSRIRIQIRIRIRIRSRTRIHLPGVRIPNTANMASRLGCAVVTTIPLFLLYKKSNKGILNLPKILVLVGQLRDGGGLRPLLIRSQSV
jgi:hypothetical protein